MTAMAYQETPGALAPRIGSREFETTVSEIARRLHKSVLQLNKADKRLLEDLGRDEPRYPMRVVQRLCDISRRSSAPEDREAFAELIRAASTPAADIDVATAFDQETEAQGPADVAEREFEKHPDPTRGQRCLARLTRQFVTTRTAIDAVRRRLHFA